jgi:hypothetical protein
VDYNVENLMALDKISALIETLQMRLDQLATAAGIDLETLEAEATEESVIEGEETAEVAVESETV